MHHLLIFGPPGVGKGTQSALIAEKLNLFHLSTGEYLRKAINDGTELGLKAKDIVEKGKLVPDDIMIGIVAQALEDNTSGKDGFILDGFPRTLDQAKALDVIFRKMDVSDIRVLYLTSHEDELVERLLKRGRKDDTEEIIRHRLHIYEESTKPIIDYYRNTKEVLEIDGVGSVEDIFVIISEKLNK
jgi:adenylate kinase